MPKPVERVDPIVFRPNWALTQAEYVELRSKPLPPTPGPYRQLLAALKPPPWQTRAACRGQDVNGFIVEAGAAGREKAAAAKAVCAACTVRPECLATALEDSSLQGIWGGLSSRERSNLRRARRIA